MIRYLVLDIDGCDFMGYIFFMLSIKWKEGIILDIVEGILL